MAKKFDWESLEKKARERDYGTKAHIVSNQNNTSQRNNDDIDWDSLFAKAKAMDYPNTSSQNKSNIQSSSQKAAADFIDNQSADSMSYDEKKEYLKEQKKTARNNVLSAVGDYVKTAFFAGVSKDEEEDSVQKALNNFNNAKNNYEQSKHNIDDFNRNELALKSEELLKNNSQAAQLLDKAYNAKTTESEATASSGDDLTTAILSLKGLSDGYDASKNTSEYNNAMDELNALLKQNNSDLTAENLMQYYMNQQNIKQSQEVNEGAKQAAKEHPTVMGAARMLTSPYSAAANAATTVGDLVTDGNYTYNGANAIEDFRRGAKSGIEQEVQETAQEHNLPFADKDIVIGGNNYGNVYSNLYDAIDMGAEVAYTSLISGGGITGGISAKSPAEKLTQAAATGMFTSSTMGEQTSQMKAEGESIKDVYAKAGKDAVINFATEMMGTPLEKFDGVLPTVASEMLEEVIGNAVSNLDDVIRLQDEGEIKQAYNGYIAQGKSESEALSLTIKSLLADDIYAAGMAAISSFGMAGGQSVLNSVNKNSMYRAAGQELKNSGNVQDEINRGLSADAQSKAYQAAQDLQNPLEQSAYDNNSETADYSVLSNKKLGRLQHYNAQNAQSEFELLAKSAEAYDEEESKSYVMAYYDNGYNGDVADYNTGFNAAYMAQKQGKSLEEAYQSAIDNGSHITPIQAEIAYDAAENSTLTAEFKDVLSAPTKVGATVVAKSVDEQQKKTIDFIGRMAEMAGVEVVIPARMQDVGLPDANGAYTNGKIVLPLDNQGGMMNVYLGHEMFHHFKINTPDYSNVLQNFVIEKFKSDASYDYEQRVDEIINNYGFKGTREEQVALANEEIAANACFTVFSDEANVKQFVQQDATLAQKVHDFFVDLIDRMKKALQSLSKRNKEYNALSKDIKAKEQIVSMFNDCLKESQKNNTTTSDSVRYSFKNIEKIGQVDKNNIKIKGNFVIENENDLKSVIKKSLNKTEIKENYYLGNIKTGVKEKITDDLGFNIFKYGDYAFSISSDGIRHINKHFKSIDDIVEAIYCLYDAVNNYDTVSIDEKEKQKYNRNKLIFNKHYNDFDYRSVEIVSKKNRTFDLVSFFIIKNNKKRNKGYGLANTQKTGELASQAAFVSNNIISQNETTVNSNNMQDKPKYSLKDSDGNELSKQQQEYFKDSKVRDQNGRLQVVYHKTDSDFNVIDFNKGVQGLFWFTSSKDNYQNGNVVTPGIRNYQNAKIMSLYANIVNPAGWDEYDKYGIFQLKALGYDGAILNNGDGTFDGFVFDNSNQIKNTDNLNPTENEDIRFSLKENVEQKKELIAVHNISEEKLLKTLRLGGMPMPSIAIAKAEYGHTEFGDVSLVFPSSTIDPAKPNNDVYSGDAYTPTYPTVDYKLSSKAKDIYDRALDLNGAAFYKSVRYAPDNVLNRIKQNGIEGFINDEMQDYGLKQLYLFETTGKTVPMQYKTDRRELDKNTIEIYEYLTNTLRDEIQEFNGFNGKEWNAKYHDTFKNTVKEYYKSIMPSLNDEELENIFNHEYPIRPSVINKLNGIKHYLQNGTVTENTVSDEVGTKAKIDLLIDKQAFEKWVNNLFDGIIEKEGIRNNKGIYTNSGNRRSFEALHYEHNLENVVRAMKEQGRQGIGAFGMNIFGSSKIQYNSIEEIKQNSDKLVDGSDENAKALYEELRSNLSHRFYELASSLPNYSHLSAIDDACNVLIESVLNYKTKTGMDNYIRKELQGWATYSPSIVDDLIAIVDDIRNLPAAYFEAKPQRAVGFNEVYIAIIPDNSSIELKNALDDAGVNYETYKSGNKEERLEKLNSLDDVMFSRKEQPIDYNTLLEENEELSSMNKDLKKMLEITSSQNEKLKNEFKITDRHNISNTAVDKVAAKLRKEYSSTYNKKSLVSRLSGLYDYIANAGVDIDMGYIWQNAIDIAKNIIANTQHKDTSVFDEYKGLRSYIRNTDIKVPQSVQDSFTDYNAFRKANFGRLRLTNNGIELDSFFSELSTDYPEFFDSGLSETEQLESLANFFEATSPVYYNAAELDAENMGLNLDQYANIVAGDIFDKYFEVPEVMTVAEKHKKEITELKAHYRQRIDDVRQSYKDRYEERLKEVKAENKERVTKLKQDKIDALAKQKAHFEDVSKRGKERREKSKLRASIRRSLNKIASMGANPNKKKHIPNSISDSVKLLANAVTLDDTQQDYRLSQKLTEFKSGFERISDDSQYSTISELYNEYISKRIIELEKRSGNTPLKQLSLEVLKEIDELIKMTVQSINNINRLFQEGRNNTIDEYVDKISEELSVYSKDKIRDGVLSSLAYNSMKPEYFFQYLGSETFLELYHDLRKGEDVWAVDISEARDFVLETRKKHGYKKWDTKTVQKFNTSYGEIELTLQERLALYANSLGEHTKNHLLGGGFKYQEPKKKGLNKLKKHKNDVSNHRLSIDDVEQIVSSLTEEQRSYVRDMIEYLSTVMGEKGNTVTRELYDIELFKEKMYYPAKVDEKSRHNSSKEYKADKKIKNAGFTNSALPNAPQPIKLIDFDDVWASHIDEMAKFHAFVLPLENIDRVYNQYQATDDKEYSSIKQMIESAYGSKALTYIDDLITDINGGVVHEAGTDFISKLTSKFKKNAVFASASVVVQQPSAIGRALSEIDAKYFAKTTLTGFNRKDYAEMKKYAPVAIIKEMGYFDTNMAQSTVDFLNNNDYEGIKEKAKAFVVDGSYRDDALSFFASKADEITWTHIWNACKSEVKAKNSDLTEEQILVKAGERFTEVITKTQVYDSVFSRSGLMRSKDIAVKNAMAFMAEPTTSLNMFVNSVIQAKRGNISKTQAAKTLGSLVAASVLNSLLKSIVTAARADDDDKDWAEVYLAQLIPNFIDNLNPLNQIAFLKDIINIFQGYDVTRADMNLFSDLYDAITQLDSDKVSTYKKITGLAGALAAFLGLPVKNIIRDVESAFNVCKDFFDDKKFSSDAAYDLFKDEINNMLGFELFKTNLEKADKAVKKGDMSTYNEYADKIYATDDAYDLLYSVLKKYGYNSTEYNNAKNKCIDVKKENGAKNPNPDTSMKNKAIKEYAKLQEHGPHDEYEIVRQLCMDLYGTREKFDEALENYKSKSDN